MHHILIVVGRTVAASQFITGPTPTVLYCMTIEKIKVKVKGRFSGFCINLIVTKLLAVSFHFHSQRNVTLVKVVLNVFYFY